MLLVQLEKESGEVSQNSFVWAEICTIPLVFFYHNKDCFYFLKIQYTKSPGLVSLSSGHVPASDPS